MSTIENKTRDLIASIPDNITLVAAVKTRTCHEVLQAVKGGLRHIGHNYMQEALAMKKNFETMQMSDSERELLNQCTWHFIGHLQSNKVKKAVENFSFIQTVDSIKLIRLIQKESVKLNKIMNVMFELNIGDEKSKTGISISHIDDLIKEAREQSNINVCGIMTMGSFMAPEETTHEEFCTAKKIYDQFFTSKANKDIPKSKSYLSMGMSGSYKSAIKNGSNMIRIGTDLFGQRS